MSDLQLIINFLNNNSGAITVVVTVILTIVTGCYVLLTKEYVRLTNEILKASNKPEIILHLYFGRTFYTILRVQNIGKGYASDVKFTGDLSFKPIVPGNRPLEETEPFKSGIKYFGPGHKYDKTLYSLEETKSIPRHSFDIIVSYKDSANTPYEKTFAFDIGNSSGNLEQFSRPQTDDIGDALESINVTLHRIEKKIPEQPPPNDSV